jgi:hypothetical protein
MPPTATSTPGLPASLPGAVAGLFYDHYTNGLKDGWHGALGYDLSDVLLWR